MDQELREILKREYDFSRCSGEEAIAEIYRLLHGGIDEIDTGTAITIVAAAGKLYGSVREEEILGTLTRYWPPEENSEG